MPPPNQEAINTEWSEIVLTHTQRILDFLFDVTDAKESNKFKLVAIALFYNCVDELTAAHALARHNYFIQANNHLRSVIETLDRIELFYRYPEWMDVWAGEDKEKIRNELRPAAVRELLGKSKFDPVYSHLCELGTHATFEMFKSRTVKRDSEEGQPKTALIFVAGTPLEHFRMFHYMLTIFVITGVAGKIFSVFSQYLNEEEGMGFFDESVDALRNFHGMHFLPWAERNELNTDPLTDFLKKPF